MVMVFFNSFSLGVNSGWLSKPYVKPNQKLVGDVPRFATPYFFQSVQSILYSARAVVSGWAPLTRRRSYFRQLP